jgi:enolase
LRDGDKRRYVGKGVLTAVANVNGEIAAALTGQPLDQRSIDARLIELDGTPTKSRLGANALLGVSMAAARAAAVAARQPLYAHLAHLSGAGDEDDQFLLPVPMMNILNGGAHADSSVDFQEFMVMPAGMASFADALRAGTEIFHTLRGILKKKGHSTGVGDEGGFAPNLKSNREALDIVLEAIGQAGLRAGTGHIPGARRRIKRALGRRPLRVQEVGGTDADVGANGRDVRRMGPRVSDRLD